MFAVEEIFAYQSFAYQSLLINLLPINDQQRRAERLE